MRRRHRKDRPHDDVRKAVEALGYLWLECSQTNLGFDALAVRDGQTRYLEVKDGALPPSARKLTPHEELVHAKLKTKGITVEIITGIDESLDVLKDRKRDFYATERNR